MSSISGAGRSASGRGIGFLKFLVFAPPVSSQKDVSHDQFFKEGKSGSFRLTGEPEIGV
jgi:hypothetical protein